MTYALDSNIVSYFLKGNSKISDKLLQCVENGDCLAIPPYVYYEVTRWLKLIKSAKKQSAFDLLMKQSSTYISSDLSIFEKAADIYVVCRQSGYTIDDGDIIIAAFCVVNEFTLVTNNDKHFKGISELLITNWLE